MSDPNSCVYDDEVLDTHANAASDKQRQLVLKIAVNRDWAAETIGKIQRFEPPNKRHYYGMWRYPSEVITAAATD